MSSPDPERQLALARAFEQISAVLESLADLYPESYGGRYGGPTNDDITIQVVEGALGADDLVDAVRDAEQRSIEAVGVSFRFSFEPVRITYAQLDGVREEMTREVISSSTWSDLGLVGVGLGKGCVFVTARPGHLEPLRAAVERRYPGVPFSFLEADAVNLRL